MRHGCQRGALAVRPASDFRQDGNRRRLGSSARPPRQGRASSVLSHGWHGRARRSGRLAARIDLTQQRFEEGLQIVGASHPGQRHALRHDALDDCLIFAVLIPVLALRDNEPPVVVSRALEAMPASPPQLPMVAPFLILADDRARRQQASKPLGWLRTTHGSTRKNAPQYGKLALCTRRPSPRSPSRR